MGPCVELLVPSRVISPWSPFPTSRLVGPGLPFLRFEPLGRDFPFPKRERVTCGLPLPRLGVLGPILSISLAVGSAAGPSNSGGIFLMGGVHTRIHQRGSEGTFLAGPIPAGCRKVLVAFFYLPHQTTHQMPCSVEFNTECPIFSIFALGCSGCRILPAGLSLSFFPPLRSFGLCEDL